jgi:enterochelin esterase-like enzyme
MQRRTALRLACATLPVGWAATASANTVAESMPSTGEPASAQLRGWLAASGGAGPAFWQRVAQAGTPLLEPLDGGRALWVTFVWRGAATREVQLFWSVRRHDRDTFTRMAGSDLWHYGIRLPADVHLAYQLAPDVPRLPGADRMAQRRAILQVAQADPLNPRRWPGNGNADRVHSLLLGPQAPPWPDARPLPQAQRGSVQHVEWRSTGLGNRRAVSLYRPAGHETTALPLLLLFDREPWLERVDTPALLDRAIADGRLPPLALALVGHPTPAHRGRELPCNADFSDAVVHELLPWLRAQTPLATESRHTLVAGASYGGLAAVWLGHRHPQAFGGVLSLSGSFWWAPDATPAAGPGALDDRREAEWLTRELAQSRPDPRHPVRHVLSAGLFERSAPGDGPGILETTRHLRDVLQARGQPVLHREFAGGHDHVGWQGELLQGLAHLLEAPAR